MTKRKTAKHALLMSALALLLCMSMLIGTTFAWFTDSVTSGNNIIKSGTLDVALDWMKGTEDPAQGTWTDASTGAIFNYDLWEPGYTEVRHIRIANKGTLALKYQLSIVPNGEVGKLADVIDVYYVDPAVQVADRANLDESYLLGTLTEVLANVGSTAAGELLAGENHTVTIALKMKEEAGNEYQGLSIGSDFSVMLFATQQTYEKDSFDELYDQDAALPDVKTANTQEELKAAVDAGATTVYLGNGTYTLPATTNNTITLIGNGNTVIDVTQATGQALSGSSITLENLTVQGVNKDYVGIQHVADMVYNNVVFQDSLSLYGATETFNNCIFNLSSRYLWTYGAGEVTFNNCVFNTAGKGILVYAEGGVDSQTVTVNNCTFAATTEAYTGSGDHCAAVEIDGSLIKGTYTVNFVGTNTVSDNFSGASRIKKQKDPSNVTVNGTADIKDCDFAIATASGLFDFAKSINEAGKNYSGMTVVLANDIDLANAKWEPIGQTGAPEFRGIFDGQGHTISNLYVDSLEYTDEHTSSGLFGWAESGVTIQNVNIDGATVKGNHNVAALVGYTYSGKIINCHVTNAKLECHHANGEACGDKCGLIAGYAGDESRFTNCSGSASTVEAGRDAGQLIGCGYNVSVSGCTASNVTVSANDQCLEEANINNTIIGRVMG